MKKMPLGKLSKRQMRDAYKVLSELLTEIQGAKNSAKIMDASNRFYTLIPHNFGMKKPPLLDNEEVIKLKAQMVDNLLEIEVAYSLLKDKAEEGNSKDPIDTISSRQTWMCGNGCDLVVMGIQIHCLPKQYI